MHAIRFSLKKKKSVQLNPLLQATRDRDEMTAELAKILSVLEDTLKSKRGEEESSGDNSDQSEEKLRTFAHHTEKEGSAEAATAAAVVDSSSSFSSSSFPTGRPPRPPKASKASFSHTVPDARAGKPNKGDSEMGILSKILVTLLCSCKGSAAAAQLRQVVHQFREAAREASDEVTLPPCTPLSGRYEHFLMLCKLFMLRV